MVLLFGSLLLEGWRVLIVHVRDQREQVLEGRSQGLVRDELGEASWKLSVGLSIVVARRLLPERALRTDSTLEFHLLEDTVAVEAHCCCQLVNVVCLLRAQLRSQTLLLRFIPHVHFRFALAEPVCLVLFYLGSIGYQFG